MTDTSVQPRAGARARPAGERVQYVRDEMESAGEDVGLSWLRARVRAPDAGGAAAWYAVAWMPGLASTEVVAATREALHRVDLATGAVCWSAPNVAPHEQPPSIAVSPDGRVLARAASHGTLELLDAASGQRTAVLATDVYAPTRVVFGPEGGALVVAASALDPAARGEVQEALWLFDLPGGARRWSWAGIEWSFVAAADTGANEAQVLAVTGQGHVLWFDARTGQPTPLGFFDGYLGRGCTAAEARVDLGALYAVLGGEARADDGELALELIAYSMGRRKVVRRAACEHGAIALGAHGRLAVLYGTRAGAALWNTRRWRAYGALPVARDAGRGVRVNAAAFAPDGASVALAAGTSLLWYELPWRRALIEL